MKKKQLRDHSQIIRMRDIEEMEQELQRKDKLIQEQRQLIQIIKEGKEYYQRQYKNNSFADQFLKCQQQNNRIGLIASTHKRTNIELKEKMAKMQEDMGLYQKQLNEQDRLLREREENYLTLQLEKEMVEKQWSRVVRAVKKKIGKIMGEGHSNPEIREKRHSQYQIKQPNPKTLDNRQQVLAKKTPSQQGTLMGRATKMIKEIDNHLAVQQLQQIFHYQTSHKKDRVIQDSPPRKVLGEIDRNYTRLSFNVQSL